MSNLPSDPVELKRYLLEREVARWREEEFLRFYQPQPYQLRSHNCLAKRRLDHGGVRSGKTMSEVVDIIWRCAGMDFGVNWAEWHPEWIQDIRTPQSWRCLSDGMNESVLKVLVYWFRTLTPRFLLEGEKFNYARDTHMLVFANGSTVEMMSYDQEEGKGSGRPLHGVHFDESHKCPEPLRMQCLNRLIDYDGLARASCCPEDGITWEYEWMEKASRGDPRFAACQFPTVENKYMYPDEDVTRVSPAIEQIKEDYGHDEKMLRVVLYGDFIAIGGLIYEMLDRERHIRPADDVGVTPDWPVFVVIDPGIQKPHALIWASVGPGNQFHVFREASVGRDQVTQTMDDLMWAVREQSRDQQLAGIVFDPHWNWANKAAVTKEGVPLNLEEELRASMDKYGYRDVPLLPARKDKDSWIGVDQVKRHLKDDPSISRPLLTFGVECERTWRQMKQYSCIPKKRTSPDAHRPRIRRVNDDFCDCVRYLVTTEGVEPDAQVGRIQLHSDISYDPVYNLGF